MMKKGELWACGLCRARFKSDVYWEVPDEFDKFIKELEKIDADTIERRCVCKIEACSEEIGVNGTFFRFSKDGTFDSQSIGYCQFLSFLIKYPEKLDKLIKIGLLKKVKPKDIAGWFL